MKEIDAIRIERAKLEKSLSELEERRMKIIVDAFKKTFEELDMDIYELDNSENVWSDVRDAIEQELDDHETT